VEVHGGLPEDCEYVSPLAFAQKMAEETDGLVFPYLAYFFPRGTMVGKGTVYVTPSEGLAYLKAIAHSLLRQGFRRQIYLTARPLTPDPQSPDSRVLRRNQGPDSLHRIGRPDEQGESRSQQSRSQQSRSQQSRSQQSRSQQGVLRAYSVVGRLEDIPLNVTQVMPGRAAAPSERISAIRGSTAA
jgi:creatinine amidohydrolase